MSNYTDKFPNIFIDSTGNTRIEGESVTVSDGAIETTNSSVVINQPIVNNSTLQLQDNIFLRNQRDTQGSAIPEGHVSLSFDENQPYFSSPDFDLPKFIDARGLRSLSQSETLEVGDEFEFFGGTEADPIIATFPSNPFSNSKVYYIGGVGSFYGQVQADNIDIVLYDISNEESFRGRSLDFNTNDIITFTYKVKSLNPLVTEWAANLKV